MTTVTVVSPQYAPTMSLDDVTPKYLRDNYLTGLSLIGADKQPLSDDWYAEKIAQAIAKFEDITNIDVLQRSIVGEAHDYYVQDYLNYAFLQLYRMPATTVSQVRAVYPTNQVIQVFPTEWIRLEQNHSQIHLVPTSGTLSQVMIGGGNGYLPFIFAGLSYLPQLWQVDYLSGFDPDSIPRALIDAVMKYASIEILQIISDLVGPLGVASASLGVDGLSQSTSRLVPAFKARIDAYRNDLGLNAPDFKGGMIQQLRRTYAGIVVASV